MGQRESILADPMRQIVRTKTRELDPVTGNGTTGVLAAPENPTRLALFFQSSTLDLIYVSPFRPTLTIAILPGTNAQQPLIIHAATYPGLCQGQWFVTAGLGVVVRVWETEADWGYDVPSGSGDREEAPDAL